MIFQLQKRPFQLLVLDGEITSGLGQKWHAFAGGKLGFAGTILRQYGIFCTTYMCWNFLFCDLENELQVVYIGFLKAFLYACVGREMPKN